MQNISFKRHRFPPEIIRHAVWLYARFTLIVPNSTAASSSTRRRRWGG
jgi:transposase-like protein